LRPADSPALPDPDSEDERGAIGENFCQPPLLPPLSRAVVELPELPALDAEPAFELPRVSEPWLERWYGLFELAEPPFPGLAVSFPVDRPFDAAAVLPRAEKKC
jgi:hypothetical protein